MQGDKEINLATLGWGMTLPKSFIVELQFTA